MQTWIENIGQRTLRSPSGIRHRLRFVHATFRAVPVSRAAVAEQIWRSGVRQLPLIGLVGLTLGLLVVGQAVALLRQVSAQRYIGTVMVTVVLRELGPLLAAFLVMARAGSSTVVELGAYVFSGKVASVDRLGRRTMRELVAPRVVAMGVAVFCLTIYLIAIALASGYLVAFLQNVPLRAGAYCGQLAEAMHWMDFVLIGLKAALFGIVIGLVSCYHGLEGMLKLEQFPVATTRAVVESFAWCVVLDTVFLAGYFGR